jgi:membrane protease subunit HflC
MRSAIVVAIVLVVIVVAWMSMFTVDPTEFVYVTQFGRHVATYDGGASDSDHGAGLHFRWPWPIQNLRRVDRRLQHFDLPAIELLTHDTAGGADKTAGGSVDKTLSVEAYVCWRIAGVEHVDGFIRRIDTTARARDILGQRVSSELGAFIGQMRMDELISTDEARVDQTMARLRARFDGLKPLVKDEYGIELVDIRLKRFNHPLKVRDTIFSRIRSERELKAAFYINEGKKRSEEIRTLADVKVKTLTNAAEKVEKEVKREAEVEALVILADAYKMDKSFFRFWLEMEQMKSILGNPKTTLLLSTHRGVFDFLFNVPGTDGRPAPASINPLPGKKE